MLRWHGPRLLFAFDDFFLYEVWLHGLERSAPSLRASLTVCVHVVLQVEASMATTSSSPPPALPLVLPSTCSPSRLPRPTALTGAAPPPELPSGVGVCRAPLASAQARSAAVQLSGGAAARLWPGGAELLRRRARASCWL